MKHKILQIIQVTFFLFLVSTVFSNYIAFRWVLSSIDNPVDYEWFQFKDQETSSYNMLEFFDPVAFLWCVVIALIYIMLQRPLLINKRSSLQEHLIGSSYLSSVYVIISFLSHLIGFSAWIEVYLDILWSGLFVFVTHFLLYLYNPGGRDFKAPAS